MKSLEKSQKVSKMDKLLLKLTNDIYTSYELFTRIEQSPNPNCRVSLSTEKDELGMSRATLNWELLPLG
jgi:hypothetical protein